jgi:ligand-binding sensor domain-containing protein
LASSGFAQQHSIIRMEANNPLFAASCGDAFQDSKGFLWFAAGGLLRYDGHEVILYEHRPGDEHSLSSNYTMHILEDDFGKLWIATLGGGLNRFDPKTERFEVFKQQNGLCSDYCNYLFFDHKKQLWIGTNDGLCLTNLDKEGNVLGFEKKGKLSHPELSCIVEYPTGILWLSTQRGGLNRYNTQTGQLDIWKREKGIPNALAGNIVKHLFLEKSPSEVRLWASTFGGLCYAILDSEGTIQDPGFISMQGPEPLRGLNFFTKDRNGNSWIATRKKGLIHVDTDIQFTFYSPLENNPASLSGEVIWRLKEDREGNLWVLGESGIDKIPYQRSLFGKHLIPPSLNLPKTANSITAIAQGPKGKIWIGTEGEGIVIWDKRLDQWKQISTRSEGLQVIHSIVTGLLFQGDSILWVSTYGGLSKLNLIQGQSRHFTQQETNGLSNNHIFAMHLDPNGLLWLGTRGGGLNCFDTNTEDWQVFKQNRQAKQGISNDYIWHILQESDSEFWLATDHGLERIHWDARSRKARFQNFSHEAQQPESLSNNYINFLHKSKDGQLWVGTSGGGLNRLDSISAGKAWFSHFFKQDGLSNNIT